MEITPASARVLALLLGLGGAGLAGCILFAVLWRTSAGSVDVARLAPEERQAIARELRIRSPAALAPAFFAPRIGYTLKRGVEVEAWGDTFVSNELGYRTAPIEKPEGRTRILFVGDSWTYGMGVREEEAVPKQLEELAHDVGGPAAAAQAWSLALPGYNTLGEMAALSAFLDLLEPDLVVLCPTINDLDGTYRILPDGSLTRMGLAHDNFGSAHSVEFGSRPVASHRYRQSWRRAFDAVREMELRLAALEVPLLLFFTAEWEEALAHRLVVEAGLEAPYLILPRELALGEYRGPPPFGHGTPEGYRLYARLVYRALAPLAGWPALPERFDAPPARVHERPPDGDWIAASEALMLRSTAAHIPAFYEPSSSKGAQAQCIGPMSFKTGVVGESTTVLIRRAEGRSRLVVRIAPIPELPSLYPMLVRAFVPTPSGDTEATTTLSLDAPETRLELALPDDVAAGEALDVVLEAERAGLSTDRLIRLGAFRILRIDQE